MSIHDNFISELAASVEELSKRVKEKTPEEQLNIIYFVSPICEIGHGCEYLRRIGLHSHHNLEEAFQSLAKKVALTGVEEVNVRCYRRFTHGDDAGNRHSTEVEASIVEHLDHLTMLLEETRRMLKVIAERLHPIREVVVEPRYIHEPTAGFLFYHEYGMHRKPILGTHTTDLLAAVAAWKAVDKAYWAIRTNPGKGNLNLFDQLVVQALAMTMTHYDVERPGTFHDFVDGCTVIEQRMKPKLDKLSEPNPLFGEFRVLIDAIKGMGKTTELNQPIVDLTGILPGSQRLRPQLHILGYLMNETLRTVCLEIDAITQEDVINVNSIRIGQ